MSWPLVWGPREIWALRMVRRDSHQSLGEHIGASEETVRRWEKGGQPPTHKGLLRKLDETLVELEPWRREWFDDLRAKPSAPTLDAANGSTGEEDGDEADRRQANKALAAGFAAAAFPLDMLERIAHHGDRPVDSRLIAAHEDLADLHARLERTTRPDVLLGQTAGHADRLLSLLDCPMAPEDRRRLEVVAVEAHVQAGMVAVHVGERTSARRYFAVACGVADDASDDTLCAQTLAASSILHSPIATGAGGGTGRAVELLRGAADHARRADVQTRAWVHRWLAMELAAGGDECGFRGHMEQAERLSAPGGDRGYVARMLADTTDTARNWGVGLVLLARADEAIDALSASLIPGWPNQAVLVLADTAAAHVLQGEPEQACTELARALDLAVQTGYAMGIERIRGVRARFPASWAGLACVVELDERIRML